VSATSRTHKRLFASFKSAAPIDQVFTFRSQEDE
jgi:hypothetical protein